MTWQAIDDVDLGAVQLFLDVVELGSVSKAAARSGIAQPSATARLQKLERVLGVGLLERGPTGSVPTTAGVDLVDSCREVLGATRHLIELASDQRHATDTVLLAATRTAIDHILPLRLGSPELARITIQVDELETRRVAESVRHGEAAMGICDGPHPPLGLRSEVIHTIELAVVAAPSHRLTKRQRKRLRLQELAGADVIIRRSGSGTRDVVDALLGPFGFDPTHRQLEVPSNAAARLSAVNGSGLAILPTELVEADLATGRLVRFNVADAVLEQPVRLVWKGTRPTTEAARRLRATLSTS